MTSKKQFYPNAKWVSLSGEFTEQDLLEIIEQINKPELRDEKLTSEKDFESRAGIVMGMTKGK